MWSISSCVKACTTTYLASINRYLSFGKRAIKSWLSFYLNFTNCTYCTVSIQTRSSKIGKGRRSICNIDILIIGIDLRNFWTASLTDLNNVSIPKKYLNMMEALKSFEDFNASRELHFRWMKIMLREKRKYIGVARLLKYLCNRDTLSDIE